MLLICSMLRTQAAYCESYNIGNKDKDIKRLELNIFSATDKCVTLNKLITLRSVSYGTLSYETYPPVDQQRSPESCFLLVYLSAFKLVNHTI